MATLGLSKVFILDKYFTELQKFWETEKKLQDASSSNEAVHLQQRLRSLSTELVTLRNRLHVGGVQPPLQACGPNGKTLPPLHINAPAPGLPVLQPAIPPRAPPPAAATRQLPVLHQLSSSGAAPHVLAQHGSVQHHLQSTDRLQPPGSASGRLALEITEDLIHLPGPLTEDAVIKCLQARFCNKQYYTNVGPILLCVNPYTDAGNPLTLSSTRNLPASPQLNRVVHEAVRQQSETGYPQAIILSGTSGSGKTHASMLLLRQLFAVAGGGPETDAFKHLAAAFTVLRSLGSAKTTSNSESSRIGQFIEVQVTDGALYRTKIHCYFLDQTRVVRPLPGEKNYHIFYQMLAGLTSDERTKLCLDGYGPRNLRYLQRGDTRQDVAEDASRFHAWKTCLGILGIPFLDVVRVLAAVLLLGNVQFADAAEVEVRSGEHELTSAAGLLGVPAQALFHGLTSRTRRTTRAAQDAAAAGATRDSLAKALYCRTVATIVRRANSLKRLGSTLGTLSSDSNESVHNHLHNVDVASQHATSTVHSGHGGASGGHGAGAKSMVALNNAVRHATDGFIGILDMFGFEQPNGPAHLEHLCINLCAETMQHFYNTHIFKSSIESCRDEGIDCELEVDYVDNVPCIDLISSLRTGLLSMLDSECQTRGSADTYVAAVRAQHRQNTRLYEPRPPDPRHFGIRHFAGNVIYDAADFLDTNKDVVPDDLVAVFHKHTCNFGFATHLFGSELKALVSCSQGENGAPPGGGVPARGVSFRISPTSHTDLLNGDEPVSTLTQDFHTRLDNLLRTLVHARPHFVRCIRSNAAETSDRFDRTTAVMQIRSLQVLETVNLMAGGYPHRMRFKAFHGRYRLLVPHLRKATNGDDKLIDDCQLILHVSCDSDSKPAHRSKLANRISPNVDRPKPSVDSLASSSWATGKRHIFLSEAMRQKLEYLRTTTRDNSATLIQATWRGWRARRRFASLGLRSATVAAGAVRRPRPQPIAGTPPPEQHVAVEHTCTLFGLDLERPPPVPPSRSYTVTGNTKLGYPQTRVMRMTYPPEGDEQTTAAVVLHKGETVTVVGASHRRGHLIVEQKHCKMHVPFQYLELNHPPVGK